jgi:hypothetical protein
MRALLFELAVALAALRWLSLAAVLVLLILV